MEPDESVIGGASGKGFPGRADPGALVGFASGRSPQRA